MRKIWFVLFAVTLIAGACQPQAAGSQITVEDAWGRTSPQAATSGAFYMVIKNSGSEADKLIRVESDACGMAELHESYMMDNGTMGMRPIEGGIDVPAGGSAELKVGGMHVMCMHKMADFIKGDQYTVILVFEKAGNVEVQVEIKEQ